MVVNIKMVDGYQCFTEIYCLHLCSAVRPRCYCETLDVMSHARKLQKESYCSTVAHSMNSSPSANSNKSTQNFCFLSILFK
jgi:hypothetical protein